METNSVVIKKAIYNMGGPTLAGHQLKVSASAIHKWMKQGFIPRLDKAEQVSNATGINVALLRPQIKQ